MEIIVVVVLAVCVYLGIGAVLAKISKRKLSHPENWVMLPKESAYLFTDYLYWGWALPVFKVVFGDSEIIKKIIAKATAPLARRMFVIQLG